MKLSEQTYNLILDILTNENQNVDEGSESENELKHQVLEEAIQEIETIGSY